MNTSPAWLPPPSRRLPLGLALILASLLHLLALGFLTLHIRPLPPTPNLPILQLKLVPQPKTQPSPQPTAIAESTRQDLKTQAPEPASPPLPEHGTVQSSASASKPSASPHRAPIPPNASRPAPVHKTTNKPPAAPSDSQPKASPPVTANEPAPDLSLTERSLQMSRLHADILEQRLRDERAQRSAVLSANTVYGPEAAYLRAWVEKVERIGNLNFPDEARRKRLSGRLILEVVVDDQGRVMSMRVRQSSGEAVLDAAAQEIVRLSAPFAPFPAELRMKYDQLTIIRTWVFDAGSHLDTH